MKQDKIMAMILAGGRGSRLKELTKKRAKPAVMFGGKYRIIDFPLSNCANSGISTVGVLTQYESVFLNSYVSEGARWGLDTFEGGIFVLAPREKNDGFNLYRGTADAISQNIDFIDQHQTEYLLVLSGDHIYNMDYSKMLEVHKQSNADLTIGVLEVTMEEAKRFGIMNADKDDRIIDFEEKPENPKSNLASMGIYYFNWKKLRQYLIKDMKDDSSEHDFGNNIIPGYLKNNEMIKAYRFKGYWKDVGTLDALWESNMDLLNNCGVNIDDSKWKVYSKDTTNPPQYILKTAEISNMLLGQGSIIGGKVENSVIFNDVIIDEGAVVKDCVVLPGVHIKKGANLRRVIIDEGVVINDNVEIIVKDSESVELIWKDQRVEL
ncbi:MAG: glucose-1-phosphate adenylyltransferase [Anaerorhabdus sp.]